MELYYKLGNKWSEIATYFPNTYQYPSHIAMESSSKTNFIPDFERLFVISIQSYNLTFMKPKASFLSISFLNWSTFPIKNPELSKISKLKNFLIQILRYFKVTLYLPQT